MIKLLKDPHLQSELERILASNSKAFYAGMLKSSIEMIELLNDSSLPERAQKHIDRLEIDLKRALIEEEENRPREYSVELNIPSGKMVITDDLRALFPWLESFNINSIQGCEEQTKLAAESGCATVIVGNTCPGLYKITPERYFISCGGFSKHGFPKGRKVGSVCTDLWWFSAVDLDEFNRRAEYYGNKRNRKYTLKDFHAEVIKVKPGVWKFNHLRYTESSLSLLEKYEEPPVLTDITWLRDPNPVKDYIKEITERNYDADTIIGNMITNYFTPDRLGMDFPIQRAVNQLMCVIGNGVDWDENGFPRTDLKGSGGPVEIPVFDARYDWYPLCKYSALVRASKGEIYLNESFRKLAFNVINCIIKYGGVSTQKGYEEQMEREQKKWALEAFEGLSKIYPGDMVKI